jgi:hypothetical protein
MTQERIDMLDQLGFSWEVRPSLERPRATWQQRLEELTEYIATHDDFKIDPTAMPQLHAWCHEQRLRLRQVDKSDNKDSKKMTKERIEALTYIGFNKDVELLDPLPKPEESSKATAQPSSEAKDGATSSKKDITTETTDKETTTIDASFDAALQSKEEATDIKEEDTKKEDIKDKEAPPEPKSASTKEPEEDEVKKEEGPSIAEV